jgi:hypothetical protein
LDENCAKNEQERVTVKASIFGPRGNFGLFSEGLDIIKTHPTEN